MKQSHIGILTLLKSAIIQQKIALPEGFQLQDADDHINRHHIASLIYEGALLCNIPQNDIRLLQLFQKYCKALQVSERQLRELERIYNAFEENGIDYMPLKGCKMKALYPKPELRNMGDADILIRTEQYDKIRSVMQSLQFTEGEETVHELVWKSDALYLELHKHLIPSYNRDFYGYFGEGWARAKLLRGTQYTMTPEDEFIFLFTHFAKHYRDGGIGCRHVVDLWVYLRSHPELDLDYIQTELKKLQLLDFYRNIRRLISTWFEDQESDSRTDFLTEFIFASGSFGQIENRVLSRAVRDANHSVLGFSGKLLYLWQTAFPGIKILREKYTILKKHPYMLPLVWLIRPFYKVLFEWRSLRQQQRNLAAFDEDGMENHQKMLHYVGLDYNF